MKGLKFDFERSAGEAGGLPMYLALRGDLSEVRTDLEKPLKNGMITLSARLRRGAEDGAIAA